MILEHLPICEETHHIYFHYDDDHMKYVHLSDLNDDLPQYHENGYNLHAYVLHGFVHDRDFHDHAYAYVHAYDHDVYVIFLRLYEYVSSFYLHAYGPYDHDF